MKNSFTRKLIGIAGSVAILASSMGTLTHASILSMTGGTVGTPTANQTSDVINSTYFYEGCYSPVNFLLNTENTTTNAVDVKFFATGFDLQDQFTTYTGFMTGTMFNTFMTFGGGLVGGYITGSAATQDYTGSLYRYFNAYSEGAGETNNTNETLATIYLKPIAGQTTGGLLFYYVDSGLTNTDDSNISSGTDGVGTGYTQFVDSLSGVAGEGQYSINTGILCPFKPYITDSATYALDLGENLGDSAAVGVSDFTRHNNAGTTTPLTTISPLSDFSNTITLKAGPNVESGTYADDWYFWTNQPIIVTLSGNANQEIKIGQNSGIMAEDFVTETSATTARQNTKTLSITGIAEGTIVFENRIGNTGSAYAGWATGIEINTFFYDTNVTPVTTGILLSGEGYTYVYLSGTNTGADRTTNDDIFRITKFSGYNTTNYKYTGSTTDYNTDLNTRYTAASGTNQTFSLIRTGALSTNPEVTIATETGAIMFTETWSGDIYYSDIAGNTGKVFVEVIVEPVSTFTIKGIPAFREERSSTDYSLTGDIRLGRNNGGTWEFLYNSDKGQRDRIGLNAAGTGSVTWTVPAAGQEFFVVFKPEGMVAVGITGVWGANTTASKLIDFSSGALNTGNTINAVWPQISFAGEDYMIAGDIEITPSGAYDIINGADLTKVNLEVGLTPSVNYYDFDINDVINAIEQAIVINYNGFKGWIFDYKDSFSPLTGGAFSFDIE